MTRKDFEAIAAVLATLRHTPDAGLTQEQHETVCNHFAKGLGYTNPRFNRAAFLAATKE